MKKKLTSQVKIPIPQLPKKTVLYKSVPFWSSVLLTLDKKLQQMGEMHAYGEISVKFKIQGGRVVRILWEDSVSDIFLVEKSGGTNEIIEKEKKIERKLKEDF